MPELPEVETITRQLAPQLIGRRIVEVQPYCPKVLTPAHEDFSELVRHIRITEVYRRAKYIVFTLETGCRIITHLRMTGKYSLGESERVGKYDRLHLQLDTGIRLVYHDMRRFGTIACLSGEEWESKERALGIEPLTADFTTKACLALFGTCKTTIKALLLDQRKIAGIGNIYASEALFGSSIHPLRTANTLKCKEVARLVAQIKAVLTQAIKNNGTTIANFRAVDEKSGEFQNFLRVYGKAGQPCTACTTPIERIVQQQRSTFFCPNCQQ